MKLFLKYGLPWALSLAGVFYLGLFLGKKDVASNTTIDRVPSSSAPIKKEGKNFSISQVEKQTLSTNTLPSSVVNSPPLPPNLLRIMRGSGVIERMGAYLDAVRAMDRSNVQDVIGAFEALPKGYGRHLEMKLLMRSWSAIDPVAALEYASKNLDENSEKRFGVTEILAGWATLDKEAALNWANANNSASKPEDNPFLVGIVKGLAEKNPIEADQLLRDLPPGNAKWQAATFLAQEYSKKSTAEAIEWVSRFPNDDPRLRETILGQVGARLAKQDTLGTANWVLSMDPDRASNRVMDNLMNHWVSNNVGEASSWVSDLEEGETKTHAMKQLTSRWSLVDPVATAEWLNGFPPSPELDPVVGEFVNRISGRDPEGAAGWALSIVDPKSKKKALDKVLNKWEQVDPVRSRAWIQENQIRETGP